MPMRERLLLMAGKLFKFMTPLGVLAVVPASGCGSAMVSRWLAACQDRPGRHPRHLSLVLRRVLQDFPGGTNAKSHVWFRFYNELPVVVLLIVLFLVVLKPF